MLMSMDMKDGYPLTFFLLLPKARAQSCWTLGAAAPCLQWPRVMVRTIFISLSTSLHGDGDSNDCHIAISSWLPSLMSISSLMQTPKRMPWMTPRPFLHPFLLVRHFCRVSVCTLFFICQYRNCTDSSPAVATAAVVAPALGAGRAMRPSLHVS